MFSGGTIPRDAAIRSRFDLTYVTAEINFARGLGLPIEFKEFVVRAA
jgi:hypothetical protein